MHVRHYSPRTLFIPGFEWKAARNRPREPGLPAAQESAHRANVAIRSDAATSAADYAASLYLDLHAADEANFDWIAVDLPPTTPEWEAVQDRLRRAASKA